MRRRVHFSAQRVPWWRVLLGLGLAVVLLFAFIGVTAWFINSGDSLTGGRTETAQPPQGEDSGGNSAVEKKILEDTPTTEEPPSLDWTDTETFSVAIIGVDTRASDVGRADTIIVVTIDPVKKAAMLVSIPRDVLASAPGYESRRVNELYSIGGAELVMQSAEILLGTPIEFYLTIDFEGFRRIIDALGGVEIDVTYDINDYRFPNADDTGFDPFVIKAGAHHMDGDTLLRYVRTRFDDPRGDFGRIDRQQQALVALKNQILTFQSLVKIPLLMNELHGMVDTNFPLYPQRVVALARLGLAIPRERVYSVVIGYEGNLVADVVVDERKVLRPNLYAIRSLMEQRIAAMGQLEPLEGQQASIQQADVEP